MRIVIVDTVSPVHNDFVVLEEFDKIRESNKGTYYPVNVGTVVAFVHWEEEEEMLSLRTGRVFETITGHNAHMQIMDEDGTIYTVDWERVTPVGKPKN
jgi:hypothetical protein